ncbi:5976_t:CDS:2 [Dentiscutata erythropus]|uniref:5976_t:CDS:1 n=1 Tax=Dentiscutata erythropus TaxID=1348616 RepID=A0A9N9GBJ8_9GLOM|nr:5976_t:CDS:2 [Dentiscutata erythropus]
MTLENTVQYQVSDRSNVNFVQQESQLNTHMRRFTRKNYMNDSKQFKAFYEKNNGKTDRNNNMSSPKQVVRKVSFVQQESQLSKALYKENR